VDVAPPVPVSGLPIKGKGLFRGVFSRPGGGPSPTSSIGPPGVLAPDTSSSSAVQLVTSIPAVGPMSIYSGSPASTSVSTIQPDPLIPCQVGWSRVKTREVNALVMANCSGVTLLARGSPGDTFVSFSSDDSLPMHLQMNAIFGPLLSHFSFIFEPGDVYRLPVIGSFHGYRYEVVADCS